MNILFDKRANLPLRTLRFAIFIGIVSLIALAFRVILGHAYPWLLAALIFVPFLYVVGLIMLKLVEVAEWLADRLMDRVAKLQRVASVRTTAVVLEAVDDQR